MKKIEEKIMIKSIGKTRFYSCLYDGDLCYAVGKKGIRQVAVFDDNDAILNMLEDIFYSGATIQLYYNGTMRIKTKLGEDMSLARKLFSLYYPSENIDGKQVYHRDVEKESNIEDCRSYNLYCGTAKIYRESKKNSDGEIILESLVLESNKDGEKEFFDPDSVMENVLSSNELILEWTSPAKRVLCTVRGTDIRFPLSDLAFLSYNSQISMDNYGECIQQLKDIKTKYKLSVEHLDSDYHNHRKYNLALVPAGLNSAKNNKISRIKEPHCFVIVNDGSNFKMIIGDLSEDWILEYKLFKCKSFKTVVDFLNVYIKLYPENVRKNSTPDFNEGLFADAVFCKSLANTPEERFTSLDKLLEKATVQ